MRLAAIRALFSNRNYAIYMSGNIISLTGSWVQNIAFGWLVWQLTGSPFWIGVVSTAGFVPTLVAGLAGGILADRFDRLRLTSMSQLVSFALTFALFVLYMSGLLNLALAIAFRFSLSMVVALSQPARMAFIPTLVGPDRIASAVSFGSMVFNTARFVGPAIAALIIAHGGLGTAFLINALSYLAMSVAIACLRLSPDMAQAPPPARRESVWKDFGASLGYIRGHGGLATIFCLALVTVVFVRPISDMLPAIVTMFFGRGVEAVAILTSSLAAGSLVGGLWTAGRDVKGLAASALLACGAYALCIVAFLLATNFWLGCSVFAVAGFFTTAFVTACQTLIQTSVDDAVRGRVLSLWFVLQRAAPDLGAFLMGAAASLAGLRPAFIAGAGLCLLASVWAWQRRALLRAALEVVVLPGAAGAAGHPKRI